ncbi:MAG: DUF3037 domain-containing protein [Muribaculaceae bacterium]|nr:DUF3037 domain-containing protein [Muribaculaceae bacterium]MDE6753301.1 DUF3037 domain-containing protein [Muribaculaceae bacterium]
MEEKIIYEYCLLRYVADIEREEFVNVGLMMMSKRYRWMRCELHIDEERISAMFRNKDIERLRLQLSVFTRNDVPFPDLTVEERYRWLAAVKSAIIQTSPSHPGLLIHPSPVSRKDAADALDEKFNSLFRRLIL